MVEKSLYEYSISGRNTTLSGSIDEADSGPVKKLLMPASPPMEAVSPVCDPQRRKSRLEEFIQYLLPWKKGGYSCTLGTVIHTNLILTM